MRRNFNSGPRGAQNWQSSPRMSGGRPAMVGNLGLQDIDKELELLQRKREIIEQQQQILSNEFRGRNEYEDSYSPSSRFDNYSQSFNDRRDYNQSRKRPIPVWEDDIPNKRFSGPERSRNRPYAPMMRSGPDFNPQVRPVRPSAPFRRPKPRKSPPRPVREPVQLPSKPVADRRKAPEQAKADQSGEQNRLCPDREPTKQVRGRLELALGCIIKEIRSEMGPDSLKAAAVLRDVKSVIRDRIRDVMMNQVVGTCDSVIARYREAHGKETDVELVANALQAQSGEVAPLKIEDPEKYFKVNMQRLMHMKLRSLLDQLEEAARAENAVEDEVKNESDTDKSTDKPLEADQGEAESKKLDKSKVVQRYPLDESITSTEKFKSLEKWMSGKMTGMFKKYLPNIIRLMDIDLKYTRLKNMITSETVKMLVGKDDKEISEIVEGPKKPPNEKPYKPLPYYAKLLGRPGLPRRNQMEQFFEKYSPKSIKKHRTVHNLLFVGFAEKEPFDKFLAADGTVMGKHTLHIRFSEKARNELFGKRPPNPNASNSEDNVLGTELDKQITNLLSSIRKEEETEGNAVEVKTEENDAKTVNTDDNDENPQENNVDDENSVADATTNEGSVTDDKIDDANDVQIEGNEENITDDADTNETVKTEPEITADATTESNGATENGSENKEVQEMQKEDEEMEKEDEVKPLEEKPAAKTPSRASARLSATPSRIQTRRASRLAQNDA